MRFPLSFLTRTLLLASVSSAALDNRADLVSDHGPKKVITLTKTNYHTVCPCTTALLTSPTPGLAGSNPDQPGETAGPSSHEGGSGETYTTSTVYITSVHTVTACPSSVKNCPASEKTTYVTTETIIDYTTVCPVTAVPTTTKAAEVGSTRPDTTGTSQGFTTSTVYTTSVHTVTACPSSVKTCPASDETTYVTTETIIDYTTVCPIIKTSTESTTGTSILATTEITTETAVETGTTTETSTGIATGSIGTTTPLNSTPATTPVSGPTSTSSGVSNSAAHSSEVQPSSGPGYSSTSRGVISSSHSPIPASSTSRLVSSPSHSVVRTSSSVSSIAVVSPSRSLIPTSSPVTRSSAIPSSTPQALGLYVVPTQAKRKRHTDNTAVLIGGGSLTASCADADRFYLTGGRLYDGNLLVAANNGDSSAPFVGSSHPGPIRGTFSIANGVLSWTNSDFGNNPAHFCVSGNSVVAILSGDMPSGCTPVTIAAVAYSQMCPGGDATTSPQPISSATPTPTPTGIATCSAKSDPELGTTVLPALDPSVDASSLINLSPSNYATLYYSSPSGSTVLQVIYYMLYPQVTLENAYKIAQVACSGDTLTLTVATNAAFNIVSQWPTNTILITNTGSCNSASQRGVYMVNSFTTDSASLTITLDVTAKVWADVSDTMEVSYGSGRTNATSISYTPSCTTTYPTATSTSNSTTVSYADLTPEEKNIVAYLTRNNTYDDNGNIAVTIPAITANITAPAYSSNPNATDQAALEDAMQNAGLPSPDSMWNKTASDLAGHCSNGVYVPATTVYTKRTPNLPDSLYSRARNPRAILMRRDGIDDEAWWEWVWEAACNDFTEAIIGAVDEELGAIAELICALKELYDDVSEAYENRNAIKCALTGCYIEVVVATYWNFTYSATVEYQIPAQTLVRSSVGTLSCVDCGLTISDLEFVGSVMISTSTGEVISAFMTPTMTWSGDLVMSLDTTDAWSGEWVYNFDTLNFNTPVYVPNEFTITPSVMYSLGVQWSTTDAVQFTGGASISVNNGTLYLNFKDGTASQIASWSPSVQYTYPVFTTSADVSFIPIMRSSLAIAVEIENANYGKQPVYINSDTAIGFDASLVLTNDQQCDAGQLMMTSYSNVNNEILFTGGSTFVLSQSGDVAGQTKCFDVPNDVPTVDEVNSLRSVGGEFCTSYLDYSPPTSVAYGITTRTGPTTIQTTIPTTIYTTSTVYEYPTVTTVFVQTTSVDVTEYVTVTGSQSLGDSYMKKRALETGTVKRGINNYAAAPKPTHAAVFNLTKRTVAEPAMISTWDASKVSLACSQIATGTSTKTFYTSTATAYSGTVTNTQYSTIDALGSIKTSTFSRVVVSQTATTVTGTQTATATTAASCPLQTQVSCFTITATGPDHVNGKQLYLSNNNSSPVWGGWGAGYEVGTFYLTCAGDLVALPSMDVLLPAQDMWVEFGAFSDATTKQSCSKDASSNILSCGSGWYAMSPVALRITDYRAFSGYWQPIWNDGTNEDSLTPIVLTYNTVDCPCQY